MCRMCVAKVSDTKVNALSLLIASQARSSETKIEPYDIPKTSKEKMYNELLLLTFILENSEKILEVQVGKRFLTHCGSLVLH